MGDLLREYPVIIELLVLLFILVTGYGYYKHVKVTKKLKKQYGTDVINKETSSESVAELKAANRLIFIGVITILVIRLIGVIIYI
ncbi:MAG TPA: hypothetical protein VLM88_12020 [Proteiniclasticum sp.]|nr:hypothetical protein [Proteiniclasticum sp.]